MSVRYYTFTAPSAARLADPGRGPFAPSTAPGRRSDEAPSGKRRKGKRR